MSNDREFEAINAMAIEQIARLERGENLKEPPVLSKKGDFWSSEYGTSRYRPSSQQEVSLPLLGKNSPRSYYTSSRYDSTGATNPEHFYRKTMTALYRQETSEERDVVEGEDYIILQDPFKLSIGNPIFNSYMTKQTYDEMATAETGIPVMRINNTVRRIPAETSNQFLAIILSSMSRMLTIMVVNWARARKVPYELL